MEDLTQFLRNRLDEEEAAARAATPGPWKQSGIGEYGWGVSFSRPGAGVEADDSDQGRADADHIARHDPARVLAEIDAKRQVLAWHVEAANAVAELTAARERLHAEGKDTLMTEMDLESAVHRRDTLHGVLCLHATVYDARPDYRQEWRP